MPETVIELPPMPENHCFEAALARVFLEEAVTQLDELAKKPIHLREDGTEMSEKELEGRVKRVKMASDYLIDYVTGCTACQEDQESTECPMQEALDFVRSISLVRQIKSKPNIN